MITISVIGAGNGGQALAAYFAMKGFDVSLYNRSEWRIAPIISTRKIKVENTDFRGTFEIAFATTDIKKAIQGRKLLMVVLPAFAHRPIAERMAPYVEDGQIIVLNPGRTGGALEFRSVFKRLGVKKDVIIAEAQTFVFASRMSNPGVVKIFKMKNAVPVAALPAKRNPELKEVLNKVLPEFEIAPNVLYTSFNNIGAVFHPASLILNAARIESTAGKFEFYLEGITPSVAKVLEAVDRERCDVMGRFGIEPLTALRWLQYAYDVVGSNLYEAIHNNSGYQGIMAPPSIQNRYILEDVPMSLVPIASFGRELGIKTPTINSVIQLANIMMGRDFCKEGRTVENLGLKGKKVKEIIRIVEEGDE